MKLFLCSQKKIREKQEKNAEKKGEGKKKLTKQKKRKNGRSKIKNHICISFLSAFGILILLLLFILSHL